MLSYIVNKRYYILLVLILFPIIPFLLTDVFREYGMAGLLIDTVYYSPIAFIFDGDFFKKIEMGLIIPQISGRILAAVIYSSVFLLIFKFITRKLKDD